MYIQYMIKKYLCRYAKVPQTYMVCMNRLSFLTTDEKCLRLTVYFYTTYLRFFMSLDGKQADGPPVVKWSPLPQADRHMQYQWSCKCVAIRGTKLKCLTQQRCLASEKGTMVVLPGRAPSQSALLLQNYVSSSMILYTKYCKIFILKQ